MSSTPDQNAAMQAMFQAGNAMAQGFSQFLAEQQQRAAATPGGLNPAAWAPESEALKALQQEWMGRHAVLRAHPWEGVIMQDRVIEWGWSVVLLVLGGVATLFSRWISMLHKHEKQLTLLQAEMATRTAANNDMVKSLTEMNTRLDYHRKESSERLEALRRELRDDFKTLIEFAREQHNRGG